VLDLFKSVSPGYLEDYVTRRIPTLLADWRAKGLVG